MDKLDFLWHCTANHVTPVNAERARRLRQMGEMVEPKTGKVWDQPWPEPKPRHRNFDEAHSS